MNQTVGYVTPVCAFLGGGELVFKVDGTVETPEKLHIPDDYQCNNDKEISPDGTILAFSASSGAEDGSQIFLVARHDLGLRSARNCLHPQ